MASELEGMTLADLMGLDTTGMEARRMGEVLPKMFAQFECTKAEMKENKDKDGKIKNFMCSAEWKVLGIQTMLEQGAKAEEYIGKTHFELQFITNAESIKFALGYLEDVGIKERGPLGKLWAMQQGRRINAVISHRKDPNDSDRTYARLDKIKPVA